jgi:hypothetical protein
MNAPQPAMAAAAPVATPAPAPGTKPKANRPNRKASDEDIIRLNSIGLSLGTIAKLLNVHPTTITLRLKSLGIEPADTRRAFMEDIAMELTEEQLEWLASQVGPAYPIKTFVKNLILERFVAAQ